MNQLEKEKMKLRKEIMSKINKSIKNRSYKFKYVDATNSEGFSDIFDTIINEINDHFVSNGFTIEYDREEKRSSTTQFFLKTVYTVTIVVTTDGKKLASKTTEAKARDGDIIEW